MQTAVTEDPNLPEAARIFQETITNLENYLEEATTKHEREDITRRISRICKELQALNRIRRLFLRTKRRDSKLPNSPLLIIRLANSTPGWNLNNKPTPSILPFSLAHAITCAASDSEQPKGFSTKT